MTPDPGTGFAARVAELCPGFVACGPVKRARKSELLAGEIDGAPVIAKRPSKRDDVWEWYFAREVAVYRALAGAPFRVPKLHAAEDVLVIERFASALATRRRPYAELPVPTVEALIATSRAIGTWEFPGGSVPPRVQGELRRRLLEDPIEPAWISDGISRCAQRGLIDEPTRDAARAAVADAPVAACHGDLLLRNSMVAGDDVVLIDWECAGRHVADWDLALLWTQLASGGREAVEAHASGRRLLALSVFALCRELVFLEAFRTPRDDRSYGRVRRDLDAQATRLLDS